MPLAGRWRHYRLDSMSLRLSVQRRAWQQSVEAQAALRPGLIPVVKGNGYGFGRATLMPIAGQLSNHIAVGSVYEASDVPHTQTAIVLTPHVGQLPTHLPPSAVLTMADIHHVSTVAAQGWTGDVVIKLQSSMRRYGTTSDNLPFLEQAVRDARCTPVAYSLHFPLVGTAADHVLEIEQWLPRLNPDLPVSVSHLDTGSYAQLIERHPDRVFQIRCGTSLWLGERSLISLTADVISSRLASAGDVVGYRGITIPAEGHVVLVGAGSAHGVHALNDGRSPFHFSRHRLVLLEPPHMHTSMLFVARELVCPGLTDRVDVQRPLTTSVVDELEWVDD